MSKTQIKGTMLVQRKSKETIQQITKGEHYLKIGIFTFRMTNLIHLGTQ